MKVSLKGFLNFFRKNPANQQASLAWRIRILPFIVIGLVLTLVVTAAVLISNSNPSWKLGGGNMNIVLLIIVGVVIVGVLVFLFRKKRTFWKWAGISMGIVIGLIVIRQQPWRRGGNGDPTKFLISAPLDVTDTLAIHASKYITPNDRPGPDLAYGENELKAGQRRRIYRNAKFYTTLIYPAWKEGMALYYVRAASPKDSAVYQKTPYRSDGSSFVDKTTEYRDERWETGNFFIVAYEDMTIDIVKKL
jgi:hypothetical protein